MRRLAYPHSEWLSTRWNDNDRFGHVNNAIYYEYIDSSVNTHLAANDADDTMRFVAQSSCRYLRPFKYPSWVECGLSVTKLGRSSVTYGIGIFAHPSLNVEERGLEERLCADATFVHVYVGADGRPQPIPTHVRRILETLCIE